MYVGYLSVRGGAPAGIEKVGVKIEVDHCFIPTHFGHIPAFPATWYEYSSSARDPGASSAVA